MPEKITIAQRSRVMAQVKSRDTTPELLVRSVLHRLGYRFRLQGKDLPGTPDIVLPRLRKVINVHGCFWHRHTCPHGRRAPIQNAEYWSTKRDRNVERDRRNVIELRRAKWKVFTVWECQTRNVTNLITRLKKFLSSAAKTNDQ